MLTKNIVAFLSLTIAAMANPMEKRGASPNCGSGFTPKCCDTFNTAILNGIPVQVGVGCVTVVGGNCNQNVACCNDVDICIPVQI